MLLLLLLLGGRVLVSAWPRRACVCLALVALEQSSDRGPVLKCFRRNIGLETYSCSRARVLLEQSATVQEQQQEAYECCSNQVLLQCC